MHTFGTNGEGKLGNWRSLVCAVCECELIMQFNINSLSVAYYHKNNQNKVLIYLTKQMLKN